MTLTEALPVLALIEPTLVVAAEGLTNHPFHPWRAVLAMPLTIGLGIISRHRLHTRIERDVQQGRFGNWATILVGGLWIGCSSLPGALLALYLAGR